MISGIAGLIFLFFVFFYVGLFAVGGGLVAATFMQQVLVDRYHLISAEKFYSMLAISESTPGPIGVNLATYCGTELYGPIGGIITTFGEILPSLIIIMFIAKFFMNVQKKPLVKASFTGLRPATSGMVLVAAMNVFLIALLNIPLFKESGLFFDLFRLKSVIFYLACLAVLFFFKKIHPVFIVMAGAVFGVLFL
ncbi:MAG: chromate transporter [Treponema sp.]|nr:chromate transporter [Treponema sp.]